MTDHDTIFIYVACKNTEEARNIAGHCVTEKLAVCGNIIPQMESIYWWDGTVNAETESVLILKTVKDNFKKVEKAVLKIHSYECPCITAIPITEGYKPYMDWIKENTI